jgi:hypothetical protein
VRLSVGFKVGGETLRSTTWEDTVDGVTGRRRSEREETSGSDKVRLRWGVQLLVADNFDGALTFVLVRPWCGRWQEERRQ